MSSTPALAVIIACTRPDRVPECLDGLGGQPGAERIEVFVVGDRPEPVPPAGRWPFEVTWVRLEDRHANVRRNAGIERSTAPRIAVLDDDAVPRDGWLEAALRLEPGDLRIRTGPELPYRREAKARLVHAVYASPVGEVGSGHHTRRATPVAWYRIPFSNFVTTRAVFDRVGLPAVDVPWDMDDFEFCLRARPAVTFESDPDLEVLHDRYPASFREFLGYVIRLRVRTGEKVITHPAVYLRIPAVAACAIGSWTVLPAMVLIPPLGVVGGLAWSVVLGSQVPYAVRTVGWRETPSLLGLMAALHGVTAVAVPAGMARATWSGVRRRLGRRSGGGGTA